MPKKDTTAEDTTSETVNEAETSETEKKDEKQRRNPPKVQNLRSLNMRRKSMA